MAADFDGSSNLLYRLNDTMSHSLPSFVSLWFYPDSSHTAFLYVRQRATLSNAQWERWDIEISAGGNVLVGTYRETAISLASRYVTSSNTYSTSTWNHVLAYWDPNDFPAYGVWLNGTKTTRDTWVNPVTVGPRTCLGAIITGTVGPAATSYFDGRLADVAEWDNDDGSGGGTPHWVEADMDKLVTGLYNARMSACNFLPHKLRRYWPIFNSEYRPEGTMGQAALAGSASAASHAPVNRRLRVQPVSTGRIISLGTRYAKASRIILP